MDIHFTRFNTAHVKNVVDNRKQSTGTLVYANKATPEAFAIVQMRQAKRRKADNGIQRSTDFMAHAIEEFLLRVVRRLCRYQRLAQSFGLAFQLFFLFKLQAGRFINADKASHNFLLLIGTRHDKLELPIFNSPVNNHSVVNVIRVFHR